jgi:hypothetical protein
MKKRFKAIVLTTLLGICQLCWACGSKESYIPLNEGWSWDYAIISLIDGNHKIYTATNLKSIHLQGRKVTPKKTDMGGGDIALWFYGENKDGIFIIGRQLSQDIKPKLYEGGEDYLLKFPIHQGATWESHGMKTTIESIGEQITVPAGTFINCIKTKKVSVDGEVVRWYAPGVGLVKQVLKLKGKDNIVKLVSFHKNKN